MSVRLSRRLLFCLHTRKVPRACFDVPRTTVPCAITNETSLVRFYAKGANRPKHSSKDNKPKVELTEDEIMEVVRITHFRGDLEKSLRRLQDTYAKHLSLQAAAGSLDTIKVTVTGQEYTLAETAQISKKNPQLIVLNMAGFPDAIKPVLTAIQESGSNISTQQDGTTVYLHLPKMTKEHRENLCKNAKTLFAKTKEEVLAIERKYAKEIQKNKQGVSDDTAYNATLLVKAEAEDTIAQAETMMKTKQKELLGEK